ncbi:hypothetical protein B0T17DRAFT_507863 [Bombardia bombarda]|uniref:Uncharacterized protein n=1 Tax=Bombardia bombarda TaxID=252184 RepID=A0AA39X033_9PEZI|nr:hypothetical protein B0T17DRAFT_507863 [Bombardia bombarda]
MSKLPLKVQIGIREHWTRDDGSLQVAIKGLQEVLGHEVSIEPEWQLLLTELDAYYPDKGNLTAIVAASVEVWIKSFTELLEDSAHDEWTDTLLEKTKVWSRLRLFLEVGNTDKAGTSWSERRNGFIISLPKKQIFQSAELYPIFRGELLSCFEVDKKPQLPVRSAGGDDWADVEMDKATGTAQVIEQSTTDSRNFAASRPVAVEFFPNVASLPRPDELLLKPPYHLSLTTGMNTIEIQGSHSPSLQFLADYFKRWCRVNHHDTRNLPAVQVTLYQSAFGLGELFDRLTLSTQETKYTNQFHVTSPMVIALVEGVLGYELVSTHGAWNFRRNAAFKSL